LKGIPVYSSRASFRESAVDRVYLLLYRVFEMAAREKSFNVMKIGLGKSTEDLRGQPFANE
jgi:hypothetical protein